MKLLVVLAISIGGGVALGIASPVLQRQFYPRFEERHGLGDAEGHADATASVGGPQPVAVVDEEDFDFGSIEQGATRSHDFIVTNEGTGPLEVRKGQTSCKCTISDFEEGWVAPGESIRVRLVWTAKSSSEQFREIATLHTSDPARPRIDLSVVGRVTKTLELEPGDLVFSKVEVGQEKTVGAHLVSFRDVPIAILEHHLSFRNSEVTDFFDVVIEPIPGDSLGNPDAKSGLDIRVTAKSGLPVGTFEGRLDLTTNVEEHERLHLPIHGRVAGPLSIVGEGWNREQGILTLGKVDSDRGTHRRLTLFVRGEDPAAVQFGPIRTSPDSLRVRLGETVESGRAAKVPIDVEILPGAEPVNRLGTGSSELGEVVIDTTHPRVGQLRLLVRFVIQRSRDRGEKGRIE